MIENGPFLARTHSGLEPLLKKEIEAAGVEHAQMLEDGVQFFADEEPLYRFLLRTSVCTAFDLVLAPPLLIADLNVDTLAERVNWPEVIPQQAVFEVRAEQHGATGEGIRVLAEETQKKIISIYEGIGQLPPVPAGPEMPPEFVIRLYIDSQQRIHTGLAVGGSPLTNRALVDEQNGGRLSPAIASGILQLSGWDPQTTLIDPFAADGTILIEAARIAKNRPPAIDDDAYLIKKWRTFRHVLWKRLREEHIPKIRKDVNWVLGSDVDQKDLQGIHYKLKKLRLTENVRIRKSRAYDIYYPKAPGFVVTSPPPGIPVRVIESFAETAKKFAGGYSICLFTPLHNMDSMMNMKPDESRMIRFGDREFSFLKFSVFKKRSHGQGEKKE